MPRINTLLIVLCVLSLSACGTWPRSRTDAVLDDVESYINERPDSALAVLRALDLARIRTPRTKAQYNLLLAIARDKNNQDDGQGLSDMESAMAWYCRHGSQYDQMRIYYYLADMQYDTGMIAEATVNFSRAFDMAEQQQDWFFSGMSANNLSNLYQSGFDYAQSLMFAQRSVEAFKKTDKPQHLLYSKMLLANGYYNNQKFEQSISICDSLIRDANTLGYHGIAADALVTSAKAYVCLEPPVQDSTLARLDRVMTKFPLHAAQCAVYAWAVYLEGRTKDAEKWVSQAYSTARSERDSVLVMPWEVRIAESKGDIVSANRLLKTIQYYTDRQVNNAVLQSVEKARAYYFKDQNDSLARIMQENKRRGCEVLLLIVSVSLFVFLFYRNRAIQAEQRAREQQVRLEEKETANSVLTKKLTLYGTTVRETLDFGFDILNRLSEAYYHPNLSRQNNYHEIIKGYLLDVTSRTRLGNSIETNINIIHDDVLSKLRTEVPDLKEEEIKLFSFCLFGFSYKAINAFSQKSSSINTAYSRVHRLRKAIEKSGSMYTDFFLSFLERDVSKIGHFVQKI